MRIPYFAYGSNMDRRQIDAWCSSATPLGPARLDGFRVAFLRDSPRWLAGAADLVPARGRVAWGVLYEVGLEDLGELDVKEFVGVVSPGYPLGYRRRTVDVLTTERRLVRALAYVVITRTSRELSPSPEYLEAMIAGAREHGLPADYCHELEARLERLRDLGA